MRLVLVMVLAGLGTLPLGASAQDAEEGVIPEPNVVQEPAPSSEPAPEEPALQLKLDDAGVEVVPIAERIALEEMELRVKRARIALFSTAGVAGVGVVLFGVGVARGRSSQDLDALSREYTAPLISGMAFMISGAVGMIASGIVLGFSKGELRRMNEAHYGTPHRVQWDLARSRLVF